jgi:outer membrane immunogenic protein
MKKVMVGVAVALALMTTNAAADGIEKRPFPTIAAPPPLYAPTWSGFYIGVGVGGGAVVHDLSVRDAIAGERLLNFSGGDDGVLGTVIVGADWQLGPKTVFGIFGDFDFFNFSTRHRMFDDFFRHSMDHDNAWSVGARLGLLSSPTTLWYITGGFTQIQIDHSVRFFDLDEFSISRDHNLNGFFVGAGVESRLGASNWFLRLEYRFSDFENGRLRVRDEDGEDIFRVNTDVDTHTARLTLSYKFTPLPGWGAWGR